MFTRKIINALTGIFRRKQWKPKFPSFEPRQRPPQGRILVHWIMRACAREKVTYLYLYISGQRNSLTHFESTDNKKRDNMIRCTSCNREVTDDYVKFKCPKCGKEQINRCDECRKKIVPYTCGECGYTGP